MNEEHNKSVVQRWTELGTQPGVSGEIPERYRNSGIPELTWCYNRNTPHLLHDLTP